MVGVDRGAVRCDIFPCWFARRAGISMENRAHYAVLPNPFFSAMGDEFSAMAFACFEIAEMNFRPNHREQGAHCNSWGVSVSREFSQDLFADSRRLVGEAEL